MTRRWWNLGIVTACIAAGGGMCIPLPQDPDTQVATLRGFGSAEELRSYLASEALANHGQRGGFFEAPFLGMPTAEPLGAAPPAATDDVATSSDSFSTTNIQEVGVDESDVVKNDGQMIYALSGTRVRIVHAFPAETLALLATVELEDSGDSLYLRGDTLIALSHGYASFPFRGDMARPPAPGQPAASIIGGPLSDGSQTVATFIDVSDPSNPVVRATVRFEGRLVSSRLIGDRLHLVLMNRPRLPFNPLPATVRSYTLDEWLPDYAVVGPDGVPRKGKVVDWPDVFRPEDPAGYSITTVVTLDVTDPTAPFASTAITADAGVIYASPEALYITDPGYGVGFFGGPRENTIVHKLGFSDEGTSYVGSGVVPGRPLNQYSLGEFEGYLRIATTRNAFGAGPSRPTNNVYVLGENGTVLEVVGRVEDLAPGEIIYAARFIGRRGFLVTFERIDPLFTLDLSDPTDPRVMGELKIPGYSDHLQLLDEHHLLAIGKDAEDAGTFAWVQGVQLSIFDVSDMTDPRQIHNELIGGRGTHSEANTNAKAFNFFAPLDALAFPIDIYSSASGGASFGRHEFSGLLVYRVTVEGGFERLGGIASPPTFGGRGCFLSFGGPTRGVFIGDTVYAVTHDGVKAAPVDDIATLIAEIDFTDADDSGDDCYFIDQPFIMLPVGEGLR